MVGRTTSGGQGVQRREHRGAESAARRPNKPGASSSASSVPGPVSGEMGRLGNGGVTGGAPDHAYDGRRVELARHAGGPFGGVGRLAWGEPGVGAERTKGRRRWRLQWQGRRRRSSARRQPRGQLVGRRWWPISPAGSWATRRPERRAGRGPGRSRQWPWWWRRPRWRQRARWRRQRALERQWW